MSKGGGRRGRDPVSRSFFFTQFTNHEFGRYKIRLLPLLVPESKEPKGHGVTLLTYLFVKNFRTSEGKRNWFEKSGVRKIKGGID